MNTYLEISFIILIIFSLYMYSLREAFTTSTSSGEFPSKMLLSDWYPLHKPDPTVSNMAFSTQYVNYPIFPAHSVDINNLEQWRKPNNGQCTRAEMCGGVYDDREITIPLQPKMPGFDKGTRVNYYNIS